MSLVSESYETCGGGTLEQMPHQHTREKSSRKQGCVRVILVSIDLSFNPHKSAHRLDSRTCRERERRREACSLLRVPDRFRGLGTLGVNLRRRGHLGARCDSEHD